MIARGIESHRDTHASMYFCKGITYTLQAIIEMHKKVAILTTIIRIVVLTLPNAQLCVILEKTE